LTANFSPYPIGEVKVGVFFSIFRPGMASRKVEINSRKSHKISRQIQCDMIGMFARTRIILHGQEIHLFHCMILITSTLVTDISKRAFPRLPADTLYCEYNQQSQYECDNRVCSKASWVELKVRKLASCISGALQNNVPRLHLSVQHVRVTQ
jgi:hypothetical protein